MKYLYIDTTSNFLYTGVVENDNLIFNGEVICSIFDLKIQGVHNLENSLAVIFMGQAGFILKDSQNKLYSIVN